jgi:hypothetical protein
VLFGRAILPLTPLWERDHPIALVPFFKASDLCREEGCERLPSREALRHFDARDRQASWQIRQFVADARLGNFDLSRMDDYEVLDVIRDALRDGRLIAVQKGAGKSDSPSATVGLRRLVVQVEKATRGKLSYGGRQYKLVVDLDLGRVPGRDYYEVASQSEARAVLDSAASEQGASADLLKKASEKLTKDWRPPFSEPDGLILLRRIPVSVAAPKDTGPAIAPSQMKTLLEKAWIGIVVVDNFGRPWHGDVQLRLASGEERACPTDDNGEIHLDRIRPGAVEAVLPKLDHDAYQKA